MLYVYRCSSLPILVFVSFVCFFFNAPATTEIYTLSLHDALPISGYPNTEGWYKERSY